MTRLLWCCATVRSTIPRTGVLVLLLVACSPAAVGTPSTDPSPSRAVVTPPASAAAPTRSPTPSSTSAPDVGGALAFVSDVDGTGQILIRDEDGTIRQLTHAPANPDWGGASLPAWSPDGEWLAYTVAFQEIWLVRPGGGDEHRLVAGQLPAWSPDGARILFVGPIDPHPGVQLAPNDWHLLDVAGGAAIGEPRPIGYGRFEWTPDGQILTTSAQLRTALSLLDPETGEQTMTSLPAGAQSVAWAPDGVRLAMAEFDTETGTSFISVAADITAEPMRIAEGFGPAWSPDGTRIAYLVAKETGLQASTIAIADSSGALIDVPDQDAAEFAWAPSGEWLAIVPTLGLDEASPQEVILWMLDGTTVAIGLGREPVFEP